MSKNDPTPTSSQTVKLMDPPDAARVLEGALGGFRGELTVADAAARGGLALRDAETGLHELVAEYRGHLAATDKGELVFKFPAGFVKPPEKRAWRRALKRVGKAAAGVARFFIRAWVSVVLIGYVAVFAAVLIALAMQRRSDDRDGGSAIGDTLAFLLRGVFEALFWTFHPFSPFYLSREPHWARDRRRLQKGPREPFYLRVNRFVFGPPPPPTDERASVRALLATIRAQAGRIGLSDVVRVTGLPRGQADAEISRLLLDFDGEIDVTDEGAIVYRFPDVRKTADDEAIADRAPAPFWRQPVELPPITGNSAEFNLLVTALNGFNFLASGYALANQLTIERLSALLSGIGQPAPGGIELPAADGLPWALGVVPFAFSSLVFLLPMLRVFRRGREKKQVQAENGRRAVAAHVLGATQARYPRAELESIWQGGAGRAPAGRELVTAVEGLGGVHDVDDAGAEVFVFEDVVREQRALGEARVRASAAEASPGQVVFSSD